MISLPEDLDLDDRSWIGKLKDRIDFLEAQNQTLLAPMSEEESRSVQHMYGTDGVAAVLAFLRYRRARAALAATEAK
jgi:hypothetical protein